jgi:hypothetical protein
MDQKELQKRQRLAEEEADSVKRALPRIHVEEVLLSSDGDGASPAESAGELGEDGQVGVQPNPIKSTDAKRSERPFTLELTALPLD